MSAVIVERMLDHADVCEVGYARVFEAKPTAEGGWRCAYKIAWPSFRRSHWTAGVDSSQAVELEMGSIPADIALTDDFKAGKIAGLGERLTRSEQVIEFFGARPFETA